MVNDGGYILGGYTNSFGAGDYDTYIIKTDSIGNQEWSKTFGGIYFDGPAKVIQTLDEGYIISTALGKYKIGSNTFRQDRIIKLDSTGSVQWDKTYGPTRFLAALGPIHELSDGNFVSVGQITDTSTFHVYGTLLKMALLIKYR